MTTPARRSLSVSLAAALSLSTLAAQGPCPDEPDLAHWTGAGTVVCPCFVTGEEAGAVFEAPPAHYPIEILHIQIAWGSQLGGAPDQLEGSLNLYAGGLPNPGVPQFSLPGPVLSDGFINDFDIELLPGNKIINAGEFTVTLGFGNDSQIFSPSMVHDGNGCQGGKNVVKAIPGGWFDACSLGVSGDWVVSVIYRQVNCGPGGGLGVTYCTPAVINSSGNPATIEVTGSDVVSDNDINLAAADMPLNKFGYFITSQTQGLVMQPGSSQGNLCVLGNIGRFRSQIQNSGATGTFDIDIDLTSMPTNPNQAVFVGQTWNFQTWFRDNNPGSTSNFSNAVAVTFQ